MSKPLPPVCHLYARVSHQDQLLGLSLEKQIAEGWRYYEYRLKPQDVVRGEALHERAVSAFKVPFLLRPEGARLNSLLRMGDHIVVLRFDRAFRNVQDFVSTWKNWEARGIVMHVLDQQFDMSTAQGRANAQMAAVFAELESAMKSQRLKEMQHYKRLKGVPIVRERPGKLFDFPGIKMKRTAQGKAYPVFEQKSFDVYRYMLQLMHTGKHTWEALREMCEAKMCELVGAEYRQSPFHKRQWVNMSSMQNYYSRRGEFVSCFENMGLQFPEGLLEMPERYKLYDEQRANNLAAMESRLPSYLREKRA